MEILSDIYTQTKRKKVRLNIPLLQHPLSQGHQLYYKQTNNKLTFPLRR
jgi:hypothetical protein